MSNQDPTTVPYAEKVLVHPRLGPLTAIGRHPRLPGMPLGWTGWEAAVAKTSMFDAWSADPSGCGASLGDDARARGAALGEAVERYCGNVPPIGGRLVSFDDLVAAGQDALEPTSFALYSTLQHAQPGFPFTAFTSDLPVRWVQGTDLHTGRPVLVPTALVHLDRRAPDEAALTSVSYAGIATGTSRERAEQAALEELFERDATTIWWASGAPTAELVGAQGDVLRSRLMDPEQVTRRVRFLAVPSAFDVPVIAVLVEDARRGVIAFGSACRSTPEQAAEKALVEAFGLWSMTVQLDDPASALWQARAMLPAHTFVPYRADRRYRPGFGPELRHLVDLPALAQLYLDPLMQGAPLDRLRPDTQLAWESQPVVRAPRTDHLAMLGRAGLRAVSVDLTTADVAAAGLHVVRVVVPGLLGNAPAAFPYRGGTRLTSVPVARGWVPGPLSEEQLVTDPLPLA